MKKVLLWAMSAAIVLLATTNAASAATIFGVQHGNNNLISIDSVTGLITNLNSLPPGRNAGDLIQGLSGTGYGTLLYTDGNALGGVHELSLNGTLLGSYALPGVASRGGLSFENGTVYSINDGGPVVSQDGLGGAVNLNFAAPAVPFPGAMGGDDNGRLFVTGVAGVGVPGIKELNPLTGAIINFFAIQAVFGLAFDGTHLYASSSNFLFTMNPNTGQVIHAVNYDGLPLTALGYAEAQVPEPSTLLLLGIGLGIAGVQRKLTKRS